jgi:hypothetical protein
MVFLTILGSSKSFPDDNAKKLDTYASDFGTDLNECSVTSAANSVFYIKK